MSRDGRPAPRGGGRKSKSHGTKVHGVRARTPAVFFYTIKVGLMTFQCVLVIQSSLSLYPKLIDKKTQFWQN